MAREIADVKMAVPRPVHKRLTAIKDALEDERGRTVTFGEVLEAVTRCYEQTRQLIADVKEHQP